MSEPTTEELEKVLDVPFVFGLKAQGHIPTIERLLDEGVNWEEIGRAIGWCPRTAREHYERHARPGDDPHSEALRILASAVGLLENMVKKLPVWEQNDVYWVIHQANKHLASAPRVKIDE